MVQVIRKMLVGALAVPWTLKRTPLPGMILKRYHFPGAPLQRSQQLRLAKAASGLFGTRGKLPYKGVSMPAIAVKVIPSISGSLGGMTPSDRARYRHEVATPATIARLEKLVAIR